MANTKIENKNSSEILNKEPSTLTTKDLEALSKSKLDDLTKQLGKLDDAHKGEIIKKLSELNEKKQKELEKLKVQSDSQKTELKNLAKRKLGESLYDNKDTKIKMLLKGEHFGQQKLNIDTSEYTDAGGNDSNTIKSPDTTKKITENYETKATELKNRIANFQKDPRYKINAKDDAYGHLLNQVDYYLNGKDKYAGLSEQSHKEEIYDKVKKGLDDLLNPSTNVEVAVRNISKDIYDTAAGWYKKSADTPKKTDTSKNANDKAQDPLQQMKNALSSTKMNTNADSKEYQNSTAEDKALIDDVDKRNKTIESVLDSQVKAVKDIKEQLKGFDKDLQKPFNDFIQRMIGDEGINGSGISFGNQVIREAIKTGDSEKDIKDALGKSIRDPNDTQKLDQAGWVFTALNTAIIAISEIVRAFHQPTQSNNPNASNDQGNIYGNLMRWGLEGIGWLIGDVRWGKKEFKANIQTDLMPLLLNASQASKAFSEKPNDATAKANYEKAMNLIRAKYKLAIPKTADGKEPAYIGKYNEYAATLDALGKETDAKKKEELQKKAGTLLADLKAEGVDFAQLQIKAETGQRVEYDKDEATKIQQRIKNLSPDGRKAFKAMMEQHDKTIEEKQKEFKNAASGLGGDIENKLTNVNNSTVSEEQKKVDQYLDYLNKIPATSELAEGRVIRTRLENTLKRINGLSKTINDLSSHDINTLFGPGKEKQKEAFKQIIADFQVLMAKNNLDGLVKNYTQKYIDAKNPSQDATFTYINSNLDRLDKGYDALANRITLAVGGKIDTQANNNDKIYGTKRGALLNSIKSEDSQDVLQKITAQVNAEMTDAQMKADTDGKQYNELINKKIEARAALEPTINEIKGDFAGSELLSKSGGIDQIISTAEKLKGFPASLKNINTLFTQISGRKFDFNMKSFIGTMDSYDTTFVTKEGKNVVNKQRSLGEYEHALTKAKAYETLLKKLVEIPGNDQKDFTLVKALQKLGANVKNPERHANAFSFMAVAREGDIQQTFMDNYAKGLSKAEAVQMVNSLHGLLGDRSITRGSKVEYQKDASLFDAMLGALQNTNNYKAVNGKSAEAAKRDADLAKNFTPEDLAKTLLNSPLEKMTDGKYLNMGLQFKYAKTNILDKQIGPKDVYKTTMVKEIGNGQQLQYDVYVRQQCINIVLSDKDQARLQTIARDIRVAAPQQGLPKPQEIADILTTGVNGDILTLQRNLSAVYTMNNGIFPLGSLFIVAGQFFTTDIPFCQRKENQNNPLCHPTQEKPTPPPQTPPQTPPPPEHTPTCKPGDKACEQQDTNITQTNNGGGGNTPPPGPTTGSNKEKQQSTINIVGTEYTYDQIPALGSPTIYKSLKEKNPNWSDQQLISATKDAMGYVETIQNDLRMKQDISKSTLEGLSNVINNNIIAPNGGNNQISSNFVQRMQNTPQSKAENNKQAPVTSNITVE